MSIKTFTNEFQDYLFNKITVLNSLNPGIDSGADTYACFQNALSVIEDYKVSLEFLETQGISVKDEIELIFNSLENKIDKINRFAQATISVNNNRDNFEDIRTINSYNLEQYLANWENIQKALSLPILSTYIDLESYNKTIDTVSKTGNSKFLIRSEVACKYIAIKKDLALNITSVSYLNSARELLKTENILNNLSKTLLINEIPAGTVIVIVEFTYSDNSDIILTPLTFKHNSETVIALDTEVYEYADILNFIINSEIPFGTYAQLHLVLNFKDINEVGLKTEVVWLSINNDGNILKKYHEIVDETIVMVWQENCFISYNNSMRISDETYVLCKPNINSYISLYTESSFKLNVKHAKTLTITPTLYMYSLLNDTLSPKIYSIIGLTKNE